METIDELMAKLPPDLQQEVWDFAQFLVDRWAGPCKGTSIELGSRAKEISRPVYCARPAEKSRLTGGVIDVSGRLQYMAGVSPGKREFN